MSAYLLVPAYDESGDRRPLYRLEEGDRIQWKQNGRAGFRWAVVEGFGFTLGDEKQKPIKIKPELSAGERDNRQRWIGKRAVVRIYDRHRIPKQPRPEDQA